MSNGGKFWVLFPEWDGEDGGWSEAVGRFGSGYRLWADIEDIARIEAEVACSYDCDLYDAFLDNHGCPVWVKGEDGVIHKFTVYGEQIVEFRAVEEKV